MDILISVSVNVNHTDAVLVVCTISVQAVCTTSVQAAAVCSIVMSSAVHHAITSQYL